MRKHLLKIFLILGLSSCDRPENVSTNDNTGAELQASLSGQVYFYAPQLDTITCKATGACDCCSGNIIFLTDSDFISVDYCESNTSYSKGKYLIKDGNLLLTSDSICINKDYNMENELDTTGAGLPQYFVTDTMVARYSQTLKRVICKNVTCFLMGDKETYYVTPISESKIEDFINNLKENKIWDKLKIKNYP